MNNNADALLFTHKVCVEAPQTLRSHRRIRLREILLVKEVTPITVAEAVMGVTSLEFIPYEKDIKATYLFHS